MKTPFDRYLQELDLGIEHPDCISNKVKLCSYLVCCGAAVDAGVRGADRDPRTGNSGLQVLVGHPLLRALIPTSFMDDENPVRIRDSGSSLVGVVEYAGKDLFSVDFLPDVDTGNPNLSLEFNTLIAAIPNEPHGKRSCDFHATGTPCAFCALEDKQIDLGPEDLVSSYRSVTAQTGVAPQVLLTGGTSQEPDRGLSKYLPYVEALRSAYPDARVAVEASPPQVPALLQPLIDAGMDTFAANLEFYSHRTRVELLPGKSGMGLAEYAASLAYCRDAGLRTFSAVIAGPESEPDTLRAVEFLASVGTPTNFLCLRPFPGAALANQPRVNPAWFLKMSGQANTIMDSHGLLDDLACTAGCGSCGACSMEMNLYRLGRAEGSQTVASMPGLSHPR